MDAEQQRYKHKAGPGFFRYGLMSSEASDLSRLISASNQAVVVSRLPTVLELLDASVSPAKFCASVCRNDCNEGDDALELAVLLELLLAAASRFLKSVSKVANAPPPPPAVLLSAPLPAVLEVFEPVALLEARLLSICCSKAAKLEPEVS